MEAKVDYVRFETLPLEERLAQLKDFQAHWYAHAAELLRGLTVIDVGAGTGNGSTAMRRTARSVVAVDLAPSGPGVAAGSTARYRTGEFDAAACIDVVEHVRDDVEFMAELFRVSRSYVFLTTPNVLLTKATNPYHVREYSPDDLGALFTAGARLMRRAVVSASWWGSDSDCKVHACTATTARERTNLGVLVTHA